MKIIKNLICLLYTSDAADEEDSVDLGGRRSIKKKKNEQHDCIINDLHIRLEDEPHYN